MGGTGEVTETGSNGKGFGSGGVTGLRLSILMAKCMEEELI